MAGRDPVQLDKRIDGLEAWVTGLVAVVLATVMKFMNSLLIVAIIPVCILLFAEGYDESQTVLHADSLPDKWRESSAMSFSRTWMHP